MSLLIRHGRVVTATDDVRADVWCERGVVARLEPSIDPRSVPAGTEVIDATGKLVFPGFIDPHVHVHLPFMGTHAKDTWESASRAATPRRSSAPRPPTATCCSSRMRTSASGSSSRRAGR